MFGKKFLIVALTIVILASIGFGVFLFSNNNEYIYQTIERGVFEKTVEVSGKVAPITRATLGFQSSGTIEDILVEVGDEVTAGTILVEQDPSTLQAELASAEASALIAGNDLENAQINLSSVIAKQNALVASARANLFSEDLVAEARNSTYTQTPPIITGRYNATEEGTYKVVVNRQNTDFNKIKINVFDLEEVRDTEVSQTSATPLGTRGLFIDFPDDDTTYVNTVWYVNIPNTQSSSYIANKNAYEEALENRENAIQTAEDQLRFQNENLSIAEAERIQAEATAKKIRVQLSQTKIVAPFDGTVSKQEAEIGEVVQGGEVITEMISAEGLKLEVFIPEVNIAGIELGQSALVVLDAYGPGEIFEAEVVSIDPTETLRDGISTYKTTFYFKEKSNKILSGMTADVIIITDKREDVLLLPRRAVLEDNGKHYVFVNLNGNIERVEIQTGANDSYGNTEVLSGLEAGSAVVLNPDRN